MSLTKTWYSIEQAAAKYGTSTAQIGKWVERGLVRTEESSSGLLVNVHDVEQELGLSPSV